MKLKKLLKGIPKCIVKGSQEILVSGITSNSKSVAPGNLFIAKKGRTTHGGDFIPEAISAGAAAIVTDFFDPSLRHVVQVVHPDVKSLEGVLASVYYQNPSSALLMVGITGTNGKTTTSFLIRDLLEQCYGPCGLIGTIDYIVGRRRHRATHTTPDVITNHKMLAEMVREGCKAAVMEVSSHALDQGRVDQIDFDVAVFSNLTLDHLDYHGSMENYGEAKRRLFLSLGQWCGQKKREKWAVVNGDSEWTSRIVQGCRANVLSYGMKSESDLQASDIVIGEDGTQVKLTYQGHSVKCFWPLVGRFNVYNSLAAIGTLLSQGISLDAITEMVARLKHVPGRLQPVPNRLGLRIYVDFAHSDDALSHVLKTLRETQTASGRLIVVFGCGGDRDKIKRPKMAQASETHADFTIITSDNPRSEDPLAICEEIASGFTNPNHFDIELDRRCAIKKAIETATPDDRILIAGKGHEHCQIFAHHTAEFDDVQIAAQICEQYWQERIKCCTS
jgi:UDP-N-acetylmuramoyl-L-alanyl-D-glutamate--2,6-diaminopimelate ligase